MTATLTIDKAGRLVLPKPMRNKLRITEGSKLRAQIVGDRIELEQEQPKARIVRKKDGLPVILGWEGFDAAEAVREMREDQASRLTARLDP